MIKRSNRTYEYSAVATDTKVAKAEDPVLFVSGRSGQENSISELRTRAAFTLPDERVIVYVYYPLGGRITKRVDGRIIEKYLWQGHTAILATYDGLDMMTTMQKQSKEGST